MGLSLYLCVGEKKCNEVAGPLSMLARAASLISRNDYSCCVEDYSLTLMTHRYARISGSAFSPVCKLAEILLSSS